MLQLVRKEVLVNAAWLEPIGPLVPGLSLIQLLRENDEALDLLGGQLAAPGLADGV